MKEKLLILKKHLMTGISHALPIIIGGSLCVAVAKIIAMLFGVTDLDQYATQSGLLHYIDMFENIGWDAIGLLNIVLGGYIAYSIAGKPGLAAGFVGGVISTHTNAGFLGAVFSGLFAGWLANWVKKNIKLKGSANTLVPILILPLITVGATGILMSILIGAPLGALNQALINWVQYMSESESNSIILALVIGGMIGFDLGGPVNKSAWMAVQALLVGGVYFPSVISNAAILIPPLGYGLATLLKKSNYSEEMLNAGRGTLLMGIIGITEGAIPFTLVNPLKLVPLNCIGCAIGSAVAVGLGAYAKMPPIGGLYGFITVGNGWAYLIGGFVGALIIAIGANCLVDFNEQDKKEDIDEIEISFD